MKKIFFVVSLAVLCLATLAQKSTQQVTIESKIIETNRHFMHAIGVEFGLPIGDLGESYSAGIGVNYTANFLLSKLFAVSGDLSYMNLFGKTINDSKIDNASTVNILLGPRVVIRNNMALAIRVGASIERINNQSHSNFAWQGEVTHMIPQLGKVPVIGALFRYTSQSSSSNRLELGVFIVPRIIKDQTDD